MPPSALNPNGRPRPAADPLSRHVALWILLALTLAMLLLLNRLGLPLVNRQAPSGIVSYELAWRLDASQAILASWDARARQYAALGLGLDYLFMLLYGALFALACALSGEALARRRWLLAGWGAKLAWGMGLAVMCDALENLALSVMLLEAPAQPWPVVSGACASLKFGLLFLGLVYSFYALAIVFLERVEKR